MPKNINSASRLTAILKGIPSHPDSTHVMSVWADHFGISEQNPHKQSIKVAERLAAMNRELSLIQIQMQAANFSESLYSDSIAKVEQAISTLLLNATWNSARQYLTPEVFNSLDFCSEIIPDEESVINQAELFEINQLVEELEASLEGTQLPVRLQALIRHHVQLIRHALAEYPIAGGKVFREAVRIAVGELVEVRRDLEEHAQDPELERLAAVWKRVSSAADLALKVDKMIQLGEKGWNALVTLIS